MKAAVYYSYGPPEVVHLSELPTPTPKANEVLVKVMASTVNRTDCGFRSAEYFISRFWSGLIRPRKPVLGCQYAGVVVETGSAVMALKIGDKIFGFNTKSFGAHAEFLAVAETDAWAHVPSSLSFAEAAVLTEGAHYALNAIRAAKVQSGQRVLVYGATGAIGSAAVQLLRHFGARITAVCNKANVAVVATLGADEVVDYQSQDFTQISNRYHFIFDAVGKSSFGQCAPLLMPTGVYISTELGRGAENVFMALLGLVKGGKRVLFPIPIITQDEVRWLADLAAKKEIKPLIDRHYSFHEIVEAYRFVETGQKIGNVILVVTDDYET